MIIKTALYSRWLGAGEGTRLFFYFFQDFMVPLIPQTIIAPKAESNTYENVNESMLGSVRNTPSMMMGVMIIGATALFHRPEVLRMTSCMMMPKKK